MKRALRSFGVQFGNGLYGEPAQKTKPADAKTSPKGEGDGIDGSKLASLRVELINLGAEQGFGVEQVETAVKERTGKELEELTVEELNPLVEAAAKKLKEKETEQAKAA